MALTRITKGVIKPNENYDTHNINSTGIVTAVGADFSGNVSVGGVLTYEDVTSIDSVGIITAQKDIHVGAGVSVVGIVTASTFKGDGDFVDIDVDGHTNLDNVSIAGITTFSGIIDAINTPASIRVAQDIQHKGDADTKISFPANDTITAETGGNERVRITSTGQVGIGTDEFYDTATGLEVRGRINTVGSASTGSINTGNGTVVNMGSLTPHDLQVITGNSTRMTIKSGTGEALRITSGGDVTIGNSSVAFPSGGGLQVYNTSAARIKLANSTTGVASGDGFQIYVSGSGAYLDQKENAEMRFYTNATERLRISSGGDVGVGNDSPNCRLAVKDTATHTAYAGLTPSVGSCMLQLFNNPSSEAVNNHSTLQFGVYGGSHNRVNTISSVAESASNRKMAFTFCTDSGSNRNERMRITGDGRIGIGTDNPSQELTLHGTDPIFSVQEATVSSQVDIGTGTITGFINIQKADGTRNVQITANGNCFFNGGNVGINQSNPARYLHITGNDGATGATIGNSDTQLVIDNTGTNGAMIEFLSSNNGAGRIMFTDTDAVNRGRMEYHHNGDYLRFDTAGSERLRILSSGYIQFPGADNNIHTSADTSRLRLWGGSANSVTNGATLTLNGVNHSAGNFADLASGSGGHIQFRIAGTEHMRIQPNGEIAMKSSGSPTDALAGLHVQNGTLRISQASGPNTDYTQITTHVNSQDNDRHMFTGVSGGIVRSMIRKDGNLYTAGSHLAGRTRSDANSPTNYYFNGSHGFHCYSGTTNNTASYRTIMFMRAWDGGDDGDRNILYYADSGSDTVGNDYDQHQKFGVKADGSVHGMVRFFSGRVESDEGTPNSVYSSSRGGYYGYESSGTSVVYLLAEAGGSSSTFFVFARTSNDDIQWKHRTNDGRMYVDATATTFNGADYAEYFEWSDGNSSNEDRAGYTVVLKDGSKIGIATAGDSPSSIIGVISAAPAIVGDGQDLSWQGKWKKDEFGREITTPVQYLVWNHGYEDDENGNRVPVKQPDPTHQMSMENADNQAEVGSKLDKMIADGHVPQFAIDNNIIMNATRRVKNPLYDATKKYVPREFRKEWSPVGLVGKLIVRKGQVVGDRWIKMKDINDQLEQYLVR